MPVTEAQELAIRVRIAVEAGVETASGIAVFLAVAAEDPVAPARLEVVPAGTAAAAHAAVVHAAHPAWERPGRRRGTKADECTIDKGEHMRSQPSNVIPWNTLAVLAAILSVP